MHRAKKRALCWLVVVPDFSQLWDIFFLGLLSQISLINPTLPSHDTRISAESGNFLSPPPTYPNTIQPKQSNHDHRAPDSILYWKAKTSAISYFPLTHPKQYQLITHTTLSGWGPETAKWLGRLVRNLANAFSTHYSLVLCTWNHINCSITDLKWGVNSNQSIFD